MNKEDNHNFYVDFGTTSQMTNNPSIIFYAKLYNGPDGIYVGDRSCLKIPHVGNANLKIEYGNL